MQKIKTIIPREREREEMETFKISSKHLPHYNQLSIALNAVYGHALLPIPKTVLNFIESRHLKNVLSNYF